MQAMVFAKDGNRFVIPGLWCSDEPEWTGKSRVDVLTESMMFRVVLGLDSKAEWLDIPEVDGKGQLTHIPVDMVSPGLVNGGATVLCISGPLFDAGMAQGVDR